MTRTNPDQLSIPPDGRPYHDQPQWRNDFPIDQPQDELVARRDFTKFLVLTSFAFAVGQGWIVVQNWARKRRGLPPLLKIAEVSSLAVGQARVFTYPDPHDNCILVRTAADRFVAYNQKCTHLGCAVMPKDGALHCPCHNGWFDTVSGRPTAGPPRRPLERITLEVRDGAIYATGVEVTPS